MSCHSESWGVLETFRMWNLKKQQLSEKSEQTKPWKSEWNNGARYFCYKQSMTSITSGQVSYRPRFFRWLLNWCEPYRARSRSSGGVLVFERYEMYFKVVVLIFDTPQNGWFCSRLSPDMVFLFPKPEFLSFFRKFEVPFCSNEVHAFQVSLSLCHCWCPGRSTSLPWNPAGGCEDTVNNW